MTTNLVISYFWDNQNQIHPLETMNVKTLTHFRLNQRSAPAKTIILQI